MPQQNNRLLSSSEMDNISKLAAMLADYADVNSSLLQQSASQQAEIEKLHVTLDRMAAEKDRLQKTIDAMTKAPEA